MSLELLVFLRAPGRLTPDFTPNRRLQPWRPLSIFAISETSRPNIKRQFDQLPSATLKGNLREEDLAMAVGGNEEAGMVALALPDARGK